MKTLYISALKLSKSLRLQDFVNRIINRVKSGFFFDLSTNQQEGLINRLNKLIRMLGMKQVFTATSLCLALGVQAQDFTQLTDSLNPFNEINVGSEAKHTFIDIDYDGDLDILSGDYNANILLYTNDGHDNFSLAPDSINPMSDVYFEEGINYTSVTSVDLDKDGDFDLTIGIDYGTIFYFENIGDNTFIEKKDSLNPFDGIDVEYYSRPSFSDLDKDGDLDLIVGDTYGKINYYQNNGANSFTELTDSLNPFNGIDVGDEATPILKDLDGDGDSDLITGNDDGNILYYENDGTNSFTELEGSSNPFDGIDVGSYSYPVFVDWDNDGDLDLTIGDDYGDIQYFENNSDYLTPINSSLEITEAIIYPNPASSSINISTEEDYTILNLQGTELLSGGATTESIDISNLEKGTYIIKTKNTINTFVKM